MNNFEGQMEAQKKEQERKQEAEEQRQYVLTQLLTPEARERLNKIKLVKADKAAEIENYVIQMAQSGRLQSKLTQPQLISMLESQSAQKVEQKITFKRRGLDDDW